MQSSEMASVDQVLVDIVKYVYHYDIQAEAAFRRARELLLDALGCAIESLDDAGVVGFIGMPVPGTVVPGGFRLPGTALVLDPVKGAFDLGSMIRYLDHNDALPGAEWGHPSDNLGAIIATMDWLARSPKEARGQAMTIRTLLAAMIKAYEIEGCFQIANSFNAVGIDHTILIKVACTPVLSWLMGFSEDQALAALSQAFMDGHPLRTYRAFPNTISRKGWAAGDACMRAVQLTLLTRAGQQGAPHPLTAPRWGFYEALFQKKQFLFPKPYREEIVHRAVVKLIPCEGHGLTSVEAALKLSKELRSRELDPATSIDRIDIRTHKPAMTIIDKPGELTSAADRDHCMQYVVAVSLLKGRVIEAADYHDSSPWASDPRVADLRSRMAMREDAEFTKAYYITESPSAATGITVHLKDGTQLDEAVVYVPIGHPRSTNDLEGISIQTKFVSNLRSRYTDKEISALQATLENDDLPIDAYFDMWHRPETPNLLKELRPHRL
ncbi:hypothetical protein B7494_g2825 [Chlorociboria aeruginascens]|nr:hypothetical protein B7494_g2825 [Chlorociboria aeruginascens]